MSCRKSNTTFGITIHFIIEKAESVIDEKEAMSTVKKIQAGKMDLEDFLSQLIPVRGNASLNPFITFIAS